MGKIRNAAGGFEWAVVRRPRNPSKIIYWHWMICRPCNRRLRLAPTFLIPKLNSDLPAGSVKKS